MTLISTQCNILRESKYVSLYTYLSLFRLESQFRKYEIYSEDVKIYLKVKP